MLIVSFSSIKGMEDLTKSIILQPNTQHDLKQWSNNPTQQVDYVKNLIIDSSAKFYLYQVMWWIYKDNDINNTILTELRTIKNDKKKITTPLITPESFIHKNDQKEYPKFFVLNKEGRYLQNREGQYLQNIICRPRLNFNETQKSAHKNFVQDFKEWVKKCTPPRKTLPKTSRKSGQRKKQKTQDQEQKVDLTRGVILKPGSFDDSADADAELDDILKEPCTTENQLTTKVDDHPTNIYSAIASVLPSRVQLEAEQKLDAKRTHAMSCETDAFNKKCIHEKIGSDIIVLKAKLETANQKVQILERDLNDAKQKEQTKREHVEKLKKQENELLLEIEKIKAPATESKIRSALTTLKDIKQITHPILGQKYSSDSMPKSNLDSYVNNLYLLAKHIQTKKNDVSDEIKQELKDQKHAQLLKDVIYHTPNTLISTQNRHKKFQKACNILEKYDDYKEFIWITEEIHTKRQTINDNLQKPFYSVQHNMNQEIENAYPRPQGDQDGRNKQKQRLNTALVRAIAAYKKSERAISSWRENLPQLTNDNATLNQQSHLEALFDHYQNRLTAKIEHLAEAKGFFTTLLNYLHNRKIINNFEMAKKNKLIDKNDETIKKLETTINSYRNKSWWKTIQETVSWWRSWLPF